MRALALGLALALAAAPALAQADAAEPAPTVVYAKKTALDFTGAYVEGTPDGAGVGLIWARPNTRFRNLIALRANFRPELARSASQLPSTAP